MVIAGDVVRGVVDHLQTVLVAAGVVGLSTPPGDAHIAAVQRVPGALVAQVIAAHEHMSPAAVKELLPEHRPESVVPRTGQLSVRTERGAVGVGVVPVARLADVLVAVRVEEQPAVGTRGAGAAAETGLADVAVHAAVLGRGAVDLLAVSVRQQDRPGGGQADQWRVPCPTGLHSAVSVQVLCADPLQSVGPMEVPQGEVPQLVVGSGQVAARVHGSASLLRGLPGQRSRADAVSVAFVSDRQRTVSRTPAGRLQRLLVADDARVVAARLRPQTRHREQPAGAVLGERVGRALVVRHATTAAPRTPRETRRAA